jgi:hypothetical protein
VSRLIDLHAARATELLHGTGNLPQHDLEYVALVLSRLKDERFRACVTDLIRWGDSERAELETIVAIGIEAMRQCSARQLSDAARRVELRYHLKQNTKIE